MIKLRLKRFGKKREASFRLVATNSTSRRDGRPLEELGFYNPRTKATLLDTEAIRLRLSQGAQPTDSVRSLLEKGGLLERTTRPGETVGEAAAQEARKAEAEAAAAKAADEAEAAAAAAAAAAEAASPADDTPEGETPEA
jgi:small subunit ribosomal protein S16